MRDVYPIRLPSGGKAFLVIPDLFTQADAEHVHRWLDLIAEDIPDQATQPSKDGGAEHG